MAIVAARDISEPKIKVSPPMWFIGGLTLIVLGVLASVLYLSVENTLLKFVIIGVIFLILAHVVSLQLRGNYMVTMQANSNGLFFQTDNYSQYFHVPWDNVGIMEKAIFPVNRRGLRIEVTGSYIEQVLNTEKIGNVRTEGGRTFIYTIPQLQDRDKLINRFLALKSRAG
jgi:hypothetical protein